MLNLDRRIDDEVISSIFQGKFYKKHSAFFENPAISLAWNFDGSDSIKWGLSSFWPCQIQINDLPWFAR